MKVIKRIIIFIILIILLAGAMLTYQGYTMYKQALDKISVNQAEYVHIFKKLCTKNNQNMDVLYLLPLYFHFLHSEYSLFEGVFDS